MANRIYRGSVDAECWITLLSEPDMQLSRVPDPTAPVPVVREGRGGLAVSARCPDFGEVDLEVWAGDPGPPPTGWSVVFDGDVEVGSHGLSAGSAYDPVFRADVPPGPSRVRAEGRRDSNGYIDSVRLIFPAAPDLSGTLLSGTTT